MNTDETQLPADDGEATQLFRPANGAPGPTGEPRHFDHYEVLLREDGTLHELGRGAMGITYKALDTRLQCHVALKVINLQLLTRHPTARERFLREARFAARLRHPNIATVFHLGESAASQQPFYAMEFIDGETLSARVQRRGPLPLVQVLDVAAEVARALIAASQQGFIHRDLKPSNLMLVADRDRLDGSTGGGSASGEAQVKVIDFGLVKAVAQAGPLTGTSDFLGTPQYASPEQFAEGETLDARSDIYSLGATLWYALTGKLPFPGRSVTEIHDRKLSRPLPVGQLSSVGSPGLTALLTSMLATDPADRPQTPHALLEAVRNLREGVAPTASSGGVTAPVAPARRPVALLISLGVLTVLSLAAAGLASRGYFRRPTPPEMATAPAPATEKSIAVLPFKNLSQDPANRYFADAMQDEILLNLAQVADLRVISSSSVADYQDSAAGDASSRNRPQIARALGVAHIVEGSVQREGNQVRVTAHLIDARTDIHLWVGRYDKPLDDVFAIQSEIAEAIAGKLRAKLSSQEKASIDEPPTHDLVAYELYRRAAQRWNEFDEESKAMYGELIDLLRQAIARDPEFLRARLLLTNFLAFVHRNGYDESPARSAEAVRAEAEAIARLRPDSGEAHHAAGFYQYYVQKDYDRARGEFTLASQTLPNDPQVRLLLGLIDRRQGRWPQALARIEEAAALDPANTDILWKRVTILAALRRYAEARHHLDLLISTHPGSILWNLSKAELSLDESGDLRPTKELLAIAPDGFDPEGEVTKDRVRLGLWGGDLDGAARALAASHREQFPGELPVQSFPAGLLEAMIASARGDREGMKRAAATALPAAEASVRTRPDDPARVLVLGTLHAALGRKEEALAEGRRAVALCPTEKDSFQGPQVELQFARILVWTGEREAALDELTKLAPQPGGLTYGNLLLNPDWAPLRSEARFKTALASLAPTAGRKAP